MTTTETIRPTHGQLSPPSPDHVRQAAKDALDAGETHYTVRPGINPLRRAVAEKLARENGIAVHPEREVLITCGEQEALFVALHVLLEPGDEAILAGPAPREDVALVVQVRAVARVADADPDSGFALDVEAIGRLVTASTKVIVLRSPTAAGRAPDAEALERLAAIAVEHGLTVVAIETLEPVVVGAGAAHRSIAAIAGMAAQTVTINGFSVIWGLEGWRVAYLAGSEAVVQPMIQLKQALSICSPAVSQYAALAAITGPQERVEETRSSVAERREMLLTALAGAGVPCVAPDAGCHVLVDTHGLGEHARRLDDFDGVDVGLGEAIGLPGWMRLALTDADAGTARRLAAALAGPTQQEVTR